MDDFNIKFMKVNGKSDNFQFYNTRCSYFYMPLALHSTGFTVKSKTLIDNIFFQLFSAHYFVW